MKKQAVLIARSSFEDQPEHAIRFQQMVLTLPFVFNDIKIIIDWVAFEHNILFSELAQDLELQDEVSRLSQQLIKIISNNNVSKIPYFLRLLAGSYCKTMQRQPVVVYDYKEFERLNNGIKQIYYEGVESLTLMVDNDLMANESFKTNLDALIATLPLAIPQVNIEASYVVEKSFEQSFVFNY